MPTPIAGFDVVNTPMSDALGWNVTLPQGSLNATLWVNNQTDYEFDLWGNGVDYLGKIPAWMIYVPIALHGIYSYIAFRNSGQLFVQSQVSETVKAVMYTPTEPGPLTQTPIALPRQTASIRQERFVSVPIGLAHWYNRNATLTTGFSLTIATWNPTAAQLASGYAGIYLYYAWVDAAQAASVQTNSFSFAIQWRTAGGVAVGLPFDLYIGRVTVSTTAGDHAAFSSPFPLAYIGAGVGNIPATATKADLILYVVSSTGGNTTANIGVAAFMDPSNTYLGDADIGFGNLWSLAAFEAAGNPFPFF